MGAQWTGPNGGPVDRAQGGTNGQGPGPGTRAQGPGLGPGPRARAWDRGSPGYLYYGYGIWNEGPIRLRDGRVQYGIRVQG